MCGKKPAAALKMVNAAKWRSRRGGAKMVKTVKPGSGPRMVNGKIGRVAKMAKR